MMSVPVPENRKEPEPVWNRPPFEPDWEEAERWWRFRRAYQKAQREERLKEQGKVPLWGSWWSGL